MDKNVKIAGVSIIEILIAMFLVAIALFTIATLFPRMGAHRKIIHEAEQAKLIAMEVLEGLQKWSEIAVEDNANPEIVGDDFSICGSPLPEGFDEFTNRFFQKPMTIGAVAYEVTNKKEDNIYDFECDNSGINTVDVFVKWKKAGKDHKISVTGVIR